MFTGIVQGKAQIHKLKGSKQLKAVTVKFPSGALKAIQIGASIAINGTCLTVTEVDALENTVNFDVINETLSLTNLKFLSANDIVNFERAACIGNEIGGHLMSGHIHCTTEILQIKQDKENCTLILKTPKQFQKYLLSKGFIGLNGCSLTLGEVNENEFCVHLIPETLSATTFGSLKARSIINIEIDSQTQAIIDTVEQMMTKINAQK